MNNESVCCFIKFIINKCVKITFTEICPKYLLYLILYIVLIFNDTLLNIKDA